jgi:catechol 2,3-dioxygenase-like lactoylglutathione lyase family enzyme
MRFHHFAIEVTDLETSIAFYQNTGKKADH